MSPLKSFLLCLAPALLAFLMLPLSKFLGETIGIAILLIIVGAIISGGCVAAHLHRSMEPKGQGTPLKGFLGVLVFLGVGIAYLAVASAGCCGLAATFR